MLLGNIWPQMFCYRNKIFMFTNKCASHVYVMLRHVWRILSICCKKKILTQNSHKVIIKSFDTTAFMSIVLGILHPFFFLFIHEHIHEIFKYTYGTSCIYTHNFR